MRLLYRVLEIDYPELSGALKLSPHSEIEHHFEVPVYPKSVQMSFVRLEAGLKLFRISCFTDRLISDNERELFLDKAEQIIMQRLRTYDQIPRTVFTK